MPPPEPVGFGVSGGVGGVCTSGKSVLVHITVAEGTVWVANTDAGTVTRIDARTGEIVGQPIPVGGQPVSVAAGDGATWVADRAGAVTRIDAESNGSAGEPIPVEGSPVSLAVGDGAVWVANPYNSTVARIGT